MTYEKKWELKPNYKHKWRLKSTYEYKWIMKMDYKYKWDIFLDYMMKNHDIHENKNPCPEFDEEKNSEHLRSKTQLWSPTASYELWYASRSYERLRRV